MDDILTGHSHKYIGGGGGGGGIHWKLFLTKLQPIKSIKIKHIVDLYFSVIYHSLQILNKINAINASLQKQTIV